MATFIYRAKKDTAESVTGTITAKNQDEAVELISQLGLHPVSVQLQSVDQRPQQTSSSTRVKTKELYLFTRQLASLIKSGISILRALSIVGEQTQSVYFRGILQGVALEVKNGTSLSESLRHYPNIFPALYVTMVHAGEESGNLQQMLVNLAAYLRKHQELLAKIRTAFAYPIFISVVGGGTIYFILVFVLPKMSGLFSSMGDDLPRITLILIGVSTFLNKGWYWCLGGLLVFIGIFSQYVKSSAGQMALSRFLLKIPFLGKVVWMTELSKFCRTVVLLLKGGVSIVTSFQTAIPILSNESIRQSFIGCVKKLSAGGTLAEGMKQSAGIPAMMGYLIAVGEESGNLNDVLTDISDSYEQEADEAVKMMTTLLEPFLILFIGLIVGLIVFSMLLPIFQMDILSS